MRYFMKVSYDGSHFEGFQRLNNGHGVQNEIERVLSLIAGKNIEIKGAGRTDAGVHALNQCLSFDMDLDMEEEKLKYVMNRGLCPYVAVSLVKKVSSDFHARFSVLNKTYQYKIYQGEKNPLLKDYAYCFSKCLDIDKMRKASKLFESTHDFRNFVSGQRDNYVTDIEQIDIIKEGDFLLINVKGNSFYRYMVRSIVGALIEIGLGNISIEELSSAIKHFEIEKRFFIAPACGLYLKDIEY